MPRARARIQGRGWPCARVMWPCASCGQGRDGGASSASLRSWGHWQWPRLGPAVPYSLLGAEPECIIFVG